MRLTALKGNASPSLHLLDYLSILYLVIPLLLFFIGMTSFIYAIPACLIILYTLLSLYLSTWLSKPTLTRSHIAVLIIACVLAACMGLFPALNHMSQDWVKHFAVFNTLRNLHWPPSFMDSTVLLMKGYLRYYLGYYIVPASVSAFFPTVPIRFFIFLWTVLGIYLGLLYLTKTTRNVFNHLLVIVCFALFSGFDILGFLSLSKNGGIPPQIEWWAGGHLFQYSAFMTALIWVPQHLLPAFILTMLTLDTKRFQCFVPYLGLLFSGAFFYSPFAAIGVLPLWLTMFYNAFKRNTVRLKDLCSLPNILSLGLIVPLYLYLHTDTASTIPMMFAWHYPAFTWARYLLFLTMETWLWVIIASYCLTLTKNERLLLYTIALTLTFIPLFRMGYANDWTMRASLPSLIALGAIIARGIGCTKGLKQYALLLAFAIGSVTPFLEIRCNLAGLSMPFNNPEHIDISNAIKENHRVEQWIHHQLLAQKQPIILKTPRPIAFPLLTSTNQSIVWEKETIRSLLNSRYGWSNEAWGGWTIDQHARLIFPCTLTKNTPYLLTLETSGFVEHHHQTIDVLLNQQYKQTWHYTKASKEQQHQFLIQSINISLDFYIHHLMQASSVDERLLGMAITKATLQPLFIVKPNIPYTMNTQQTLQQLLWHENGWSVETNFAWSSTNQASVWLYLPTLSKSDTLTIQWMALAFLSKHKNQIIDITVNGQWLKSLIYKEGKNNPRLETLLIHPKSHFVKIEFFIHQPVCHPNDWRCLGIHVANLFIQLTPFK